MARPRRAARGRRPSPGVAGKVAPVPFLLACPRRPEALAAEGAGVGRRRERLFALWDRLRPLEEASWRGALGAHGLARLQRLRVAFAALFRERAA